MLRFVFVDQAAADRLAPDLAVNRLGDRRLRTRRTQLQCSMRTLRVVMGSVGREHPTKVSLPEDQHPVGQLGADRQHEAFGEAVRPRTPRRDLNHLDARIGGTGALGSGQTRFG
jgi:hypothetical protein